MHMIRQGGHKPGIFNDFSEHGKLMEFSGILCNLRETDFALWVQPVSSNPYAAKCIA